MARQEAETVLRSLPPEASTAAVAPARWMADPIGLRRMCDATMRTLRALPAGTPSLRLLVDETAKLAAGISHVLDGLALLVDGRDRPLRGNEKFPLGAPDWMPALVYGGRAFIAIGAVELFWVVTAWPNAGLAIFLRRRDPPVAVAAGRSGICRDHDVAWRGREHLLGGNRQVRRSADRQQPPGPLRRSRSFPPAGGLCESLQPEAIDPGRVQLHAAGLHGASRAHQPDELRHRPILQRRASDLCRRRRSDAFVSAAASAFAGAADAPACSLSPCAICTASRSIPRRQAPRIGRAACTASWRHCRV